ncbi:hypothetical protein MTR67_002266 [Solanum verrucosum]|uniref:Chromo domain-containing protein n=1 Tax=Solanum verrucosum TaxID=315347 RepID=A0AAF0PQK8_SOLVR|nr:hypothetical protein MTR67_002266 [Solanum verrucosum]
MVKVRWRHRPIEEATWEIEHDMREQFLGFLSLLVLLDSYFRGLRMFFYLSFVNVMKGARHVAKGERRGEASSPIIGAAMRFQKDEKWR